MKFLVLTVAALMMVGCQDHAPDVVLKKESVVGTVTHIDPPKRFHIEVDVNGIEYKLQSKKRCSSWKNVKYKVKYNLTLVTYKKYDNTTYTKIEETSCYVAQHFLQLRVN